MSTQRAARLYAPRRRSDLVPRGDLTGGRDESCAASHGSLVTVAAVERPPAAERALLGELRQRRGGARCECHASCAFRPGVHRVFVRRVSYEADAESLSEAMSEFGVVVDVWLAPNVDPSKARAGTKGHRGFGKVAFSTFEAAARAVSHGQVRVLGKPISVEHYEAKEGDASQAGSEKRTALFNRCGGESLDASEVAAPQELAPLPTSRSTAWPSRRAAAWANGRGPGPAGRRSSRAPRSDGDNVAITRWNALTSPRGDPTLTLSLTVTITVTVTLTQQGVRASAGDGRRASADRGA